MIQDYLIMAFSGVAVGYAAKVIVQEWNAHKQKISDFMVSIPSKIEAKTGDIFSEETENKIACWALSVVQYLDGFLSDGKQIRNMIRWIVSLKDASKRDEYLKKIESIDWGTVIETTLPDDVKSIVNEFRQKEAEKILTAKIQLQAPQAMQKISVPEIVKIAVVANKSSDEGPLPTMQVVCAQIAETRKKLEEFLKK